MNRLITSVITLMLCLPVMGQYLETFGVPNKGILSGGNCTGVSLASCSNVDLMGVDWTLGGNFSGIDAEGFFTSGGAIQISDIDEPIYWASPTLNISSAGSVTLTVTMSIAAGSDWDIGELAGSVDFLDVRYSIDGGVFTSIPNINDCISSGFTISASGCTAIEGPVTFSPSISGITGNSLDIQVWTDVNSGTTDIAFLEEISVPNANVSVVLPVELTSFTAQKQRSDVELNWTTVTEKDNEKFEIEHSSDQRSFRKIGEVLGNGTTDETQDYSFLHTDPEPGTNFYRLKQLDVDGQFEYSKIVSVTLGLTGGQAGDFYPNPATPGMVSLSYMTAETTQLKSYVYDLQGREISVQNHELTAGTTTVAYDFQRLQKGVYLVRLEGNGAPEFRKLFIQ